MVYAAIMRIFRPSTFRSLIRYPCQNIITQVTWDAMGPAMGRQMLLLLITSRFLKVSHVSRRSGHINFQLLPLFEHFTSRFMVRPCVNLTFLSSYLYEPWGLLISLYVQMKNQSLRIFTRLISQMVVLPSIPLTTGSLMRPLNMVTPRNWNSILPMPYATSAHAMMRRRESHPKIRHRNCPIYTFSIICHHCRRPRHFRHLISVKVRPTGKGIFPRRNSDLFRGFTLIILPPNFITFSLSSELIGRIFERLFFPNRILLSLITCRHRRIFLPLNREMLTRYCIVQLSWRCFFLHEEGVRNSIINHRELFFLDSKRDWEGGECHRGVPDAFCYGL